MRKVCLGMNITLDGYVAGPNGALDWAFRTMSPDLGEWVTELLRGVGTVLLGHTTYLQQAAAWPTQTSEMATLLNSHAKIVFSTRLSTLEWNNSRLATADAAEEIARLKQQPGKNISVTGGATLAQSLARMALIDEYNLVMHPVALGGGKPLFKDLSLPLNLKLVRTQTSIRVPSASLTNLTKRRPSSLEASLGKAQTKNALREDGCNHCARPVRPTIQG